MQPQALVAVKAVVGSAVSVVVAAVAAVKVAVAANVAKLWQKYGESGHLCGRFFLYLHP